MGGTIRERWESSPLEFSFVKKQHGTTQPRWSWEARWVILFCQNAGFKLTSKGLKLKVIIADPGQTIEKHLKSNLRAKKAIHSYYIIKRKIFFIYDPPHLKNMRNNLKSSGFLVNGSLCSREHEENFFQVWQTKLSANGTKVNWKAHAASTFEQNECEAGWTGCS